MQPFELLNLLNPFSHFCVGSLPFTDAAHACEFVGKRPGFLPFWPELPKRSDAELTLERAKRALNSDWCGYSEEEASGLYHLHKKLLSKPSADPILKCQVLGPASLLRFSEAKNLDVAKGIRVVLDATLRQIEWQISFLSDLKLPLLFVLDEPGLGIWKDFNFQTRERLREAYTYIFVRLGEAGHFLGLHCCAEFNPELFDLPFDLFSFDSCVPELMQNLQSVDLARWKMLFERGVVLAPGVVPARCDINFENTLEQGFELFHAWRSFAVQFGAPAKSILFSANCGHANVSTAWLEAIYDKLLVSSLEQAA